MPIAYIMRGVKMREKETVFFRLFHCLLNSLPLFVTLTKRILYADIFSANI